MITINNSKISCVKCGKIYSDSFEGEVRWDLVCECGNVLVRVIKDGDSK